VTDIKLKVDGLHKIFTVHNQNGREIEGFMHISFELKKGSFCALMGPSGAGKSSLLKCIYRTYLPTGGSVELTCTDGTTYDLVRLSEGEIINLRKKEIGYVSQFLKVLPRISAVNVVAQPLIDWGESEVSSKEMAKDILNNLGIREELFDISPLTFSGGEQQRVNIAKAIIAPKELLLLDEPTASLDQVKTEKVIEMLKILKDKGITMIGIFHDQRLTDMIADETIRLKRVIDESGITV